MIIVTGAEYARVRKQHADQRATLRSSRWLCLAAKPIEGWLKLLGNMKVLENYSDSKLKKNLCIVLGFAKWLVSIWSVASSSDSASSGVVGAGGMARSELPLDPLDLPRMWGCGSTEWLRNGCGWLVAILSADQWPNLHLNSPRTWILASQPQHRFPRCPTMLHYVQAMLHSSNHETT